MQSDDIELKLIRDSKLANIQKSLKYAVKQGPMSVDWQPISATTKTTSNIVFQVTAPSENAAINRCFLLDTTYEFTLTFSGAAGQLNGVTPFDWGNKVALQAFPFNRNIVTCTLNINGASNSCSIQEVLPLLSRMFDPAELNEFNGMTPTLLDKYRSYAEMVALPSNPLGGANYIGNDTYLPGRGNHPLVSAPTYVSLPGPGVLSTGEAGTTSIAATFSVRVIEPLFISPLLFKPYPNNDQAIIGVNQLSLNLSTDATFSRFFSVAIQAGQNYDVAVSAASITNCDLYLNYMSLQPSQSIVTRNILPFMEYSLHTKDFAAIAVDAQTLSSNSYQVGSIPDKIIIAIRPTARDIKTADYYLPITGVNFTLGTQSGLLSTAKDYHLYRMSCDAGLKGMSWYDWSGLINKSTASVKTAGSILVIDPTMLNLPDYLAPGSVGQFNISFKVNVRNDTGGAFNGTMVVIFCNSGAYVTQSGKSAFFLNLLDKQSVIDINAQQSEDAMSKSQLDRLVGGAGLSDSVAMELEPSARRAGARSAGSRSGGRKSKLEHFIV